MIDTSALIIPAFIAGILTFLAPCTLPLVPAYLGFISGASAKDMRDPRLAAVIRRRVLLNGVFYVLGFSLVFILLGLLFGIGGAALVMYQRVLIKIGGVFILFFGLYLVGVFDRILVLRAALSSEHHFRLLYSLKPGTPSSSFIFGATFAFGWTPCVGPILGSILFLASSTATAWQGTFLLSVFSLGLAIPFLLIAWGVGHATQTIHRLSVVLPYVSTIGGILLITLGILLLTDQLGLWLSWAYRLLGLFQYERLLDYL
ncbi:sulfite exporter TauE/SafE family protein [Candidatus Uhrbacteria bacterium]|nr:sulfite exporter TauE/SafE family protein [Candidatus Uhrbacteria bacterium]